jgi:hypothetical protein
MEIDLRHLPGEAEAGPDYYRLATRRIDEAVDRKLSEGIAADQVNHLSVFAFARLPLLVYLGSRLDDTVPTDVYQRHRAGESWLWSPEARPAEFAVTGVTGGPPADEAVLILNVSGTIQPVEVPASIAGLRTYTVAPTDTAPAPDILRDRASLDAFEATIRTFFAQLETTAKNVRRLHVLPAIPLSAAVTLGRAHDPQVHPRLLIHDRTDTGYQPALEIS